MKLSLRIPDSHCICSPDDDAEPLVSRVIAFDIARYVFGSEAEFQRRASVDKALQKALELARGLPNVQSHVDGREVVKEIVVPGKLVNLVVR